MTGSPLGNDHDTCNAAKRRRRPDWFVALAMLVGLAVTSGVVIDVGRAEGWSEWLVVLLAVVFGFFGAIGAGIFALGDV